VKVLILGGAGFIGVHLARRLQAAGGEVTIVDDFSRGRDDPELAALGVPVLHADLTAAASYERLPRGWDHVYMLAAVVGVRNVEKDPARVIRINTLALMNLLDWLRPGERLFFHIGKGVAQRDSSSRRGQKLTPAHRDYFLGRSQ
jgi:UDP-glucose 4-epimerase/UDP-glucuronate decarboxylase